MVKLVFKMIPALIVFEACGSDESSEISATGTIEATEVTVSAQAGGVVMQLRADEASSVQVGDTLAVIDATDWMYQLQQAEGNLAATEAQYKLALRAVREEDLIQAETNYKSAETDLKRMQELAPLGSVSQKQLEDARTRFTLAQQAYEKLKRGSRREEIDMARARRDQAEGQALAIRKKVSDCTVTAPLSGTVTKRFIEKGELAGQGASLFRIANLAEMNLMIYVSETELPRIKV
ncbi:MAG TPA: efflux RND transporter periplasmic adaptor subunit, partial [Bacteroidota bacterium]|nr:efflux RND transporter periplasmic adaptor subunit [Bacteroidota bacterium]